MFCIVAAWPRLGRLKPNSIPLLLVTCETAVWLVVVADLLHQGKPCVSLVAAGKVGYTADTHIGRLSPSLSPAGRGERAFVSVALTGRTPSWTQVRRAESWKGLSGQARSCPRVPSAWSMATTLPCSVV